MDAVEREAIGGQAKLADVIASFKWGLSKTRDTSRGSQRGHNRNECINRAISSVAGTEAQSTKPFGEPYRAHREKCDGRG